MAVAARRPIPRSWGRLFLLGLTTGFVYFAGTLYWTGDVMQVYGGIPAPLAFGVGLLLDAYLALFPALFAVIVGRLVQRVGPHAVLVAPLVWVGTEYARGYLFTGFPWVVLGYSQVNVLPVAQVASLVGVFGLSALVALGSAALAYAAVGQGRTSRLAVAAFTLVLVGGAAGWGWLRVQDNALTGEGQPLRLALLQGNVAQDDKWDPAKARRILDGYLEMTREAARQDAQLIVWPESSTPFFFEEDPVGNAEIRRVARETGRYVLIGSDQLEPGDPPRYYNAAFLLGPDGRTLAVYRKMHLVPFGEYVPLKTLLFFASPLVESVSDFSPGTEAVMLPVGSGPVSTAICYEVVYPDLVRQFVLSGAKLLTTITNDAWYGRSSAPYQHFEQARMRAIELGRYLARSANTGISGIVDPYGRVVMRSALFEPAVLTGEVRLLSGQTLYARVGDVFAYGCIAVTLAAAVTAFSRVHRTPRRS